MCKCLTGSVVCCCCSCAWNILLLIIFVAIVVAVAIGLGIYFGIYHPDDPNVAKFFNQTIEKVKGG
ncbi:protein midgut expression 1-like [Phlebotomus papatasi]|uniref:protein midgut expression 1-like n=1 Tax=Phlebotomus papatasi TaxID=29031 RepID=UPI002483720C|nr:protein midgut expression 1-like [Phlebotomus papatasi]